MAYFDGNIQVVTSGLVGYWDGANTRSLTSGSTTWRDISGNNNNGTNANIFSSEFGGGISFGGSSEVTLPNSSVYRDINDYTYTVAFKLNTIPPSGGTYTLLSIGGSLADQALMVCNSYVVSNNTFLAISYNSTPTAQFISSNFPINTSSVFVVSQVRNNASNLLQFYVNGSNMVSESISGTAGYGGTSYSRIGGRNALQYFSGSIYYCSIYNRALNSNEIVQNYNALKSRFGLT